MIDITLQNLETDLVQASIDTPVLLVGLALPGAGFAQTGVEPRQVDETGALMPRQGAPALVQADAPTGPVNGRAATAADSQVVADLDYTAWEQMANRAETAIGARGSTSMALPFFCRWRFPLHQQRRTHRAYFLV